MTFSRFDCAYSDVNELAPDADAIIGLSVPDGALAIAKKLKMFFWLHSGSMTCTKWGHFLSSSNSASNLQYSLCECGCGS